MLEKFVRWETNLLKATVGIWIAFSTVVLVLVPTANAMNSPIDAELPGALLLPLMAAGGIFCYGTLIIIAVLLVQALRSQVRGG